MFTFVHLKITILGTFSNTEPKTQIVPRSSQIRGSVACHSCSLQIRKQAAMSRSECRAEKRLTKEIVFPFAFLPRRMNPID